MTAETEKPKLKVGDNFRLNKEIKVEYFRDSFPEGSEGTVVNISKDGSLVFDLYKIGGSDHKKQDILNDLLHRRLGRRNFVVPVHNLHDNYELVEKPEQVIYMHHFHGVDISEDVKEIEKILRNNNITNFKICDQPYGGPLGRPLLCEGYLLPGLNIRFGEMCDLNMRLILRSQEEQGYSGPCIDWSESDLPALKEKLNDIFSNDVVNRLQAILDESKANEDVREFAEFDICNSYSKKPSEKLEQVKQLSDKGIDINFIFGFGIPDIKDYFEIADKLAAKLDKKEIKEYTNWLGKKHIDITKAKGLGNDLYQIYDTFGDIIDSDDIPKVIELFKDISSNEGLTEKEKEKSKSEVAEYYKTYKKEEEKKEK